MSTNIKVAVRVRNLPSWHGRDGMKDSLEYNRDIVKVDRQDPKTRINTHIVIGDPPHGMEEKEFTYDCVFPPTDGQEFLYNSLVDPLIQKCQQGFNGCVFVYGQTASGKTYTMGGPAVSKESDKGIILRVAKQLCNYIEKNGRKDLGKAGFDFTVTGSYLEIYNEQLKDLLGHENAKEELKIRLDPNSVTGKGVYVSGLTQVPLKTEQDYVHAIEAGVARRKVAETNMNAVSSRSHAILTLTLTQREYLEGGKDGVKKSSKIHLIDLAGSERANSTGATGQTLKEGAAINQSLSCLGNVINALSTGASHVPYRDSKLTHLLSDSLGGNSLTILVACLTPIAGAYEETLSTLRFAERAKKVKNKAVLNVDANTLRILALEAENVELKAQLAKCTCGASNKDGEVAAAAEGGGRVLKRDVTAKFKNLLAGTKSFPSKVAPEVAAATPLSSVKVEASTMFEDDEEQVKQIMQNALRQPSTTEQVMAKEEMKQVKLDEYFHYKNPYYDDDDVAKESIRALICWKLLSIVIFIVGILVGFFCGRYINHIPISDSAASNNANINSHLKSGVDNTCSNSTQIIKQEAITVFVQPSCKSIQTVREAITVFVAPTCTSSITSSTFLNLASSSVSTSTSIFNVPSITTSGGTARTAPSTTSSQ